MSDNTEFRGSMTLEDGRRVALTPSEAKALWEKTERDREERAKKLPDERTAIDAMFEAFDRLRELGWNDAIYCPKDGSSFQVIEAGSIGIFRCHYEGEWPEGSWWISADGDLWPSRPILYRLYPEDEAKRKTKMKGARAPHQTARRGSDDPGVNLG